MKGVWKFVGGYIVGAASAIVVSPRSGREVRRQIAHRLAAGLERTGAEGVAGPQPRRAEPASFEELPATPAAERISVSRPAAVAAAPEPATAVVVPESASTVPEPELVVVVAEPQPVVIVAEPEPVVVAPVPEPVVLEAQPAPPAETVAAEPTIVVAEPAIPVAEPSAEEPEPLVVAAAEVVETVEPPLVVEAAPPLEAAPASEETTVEAVTFDDLVAEPVAPSAPPPGEPLEHPGLEDLRARIEQTKAAVREALERPFEAEAEESAGGTAATAAVEPLLAPTAHDDWFAEQPEPVAEAQPVAMPAPLVVTEPPVATFAADQVLPEAALVTQIETALEPFPTAATPAAPAPSPPEGAGAWVAPAVVIADAASPSASAQAEAPPLEEETMDLGPELRASVAEVPSGQVDAATTSVSGLDRAVAEAFSFDETDAEPVEAPVVDQVEMRRRIEETRARLKAKAFDAMTSGESALLARGPSDEAPGPAADKQTEVKLDDEVRQAIDRSLAPDDF